MTTFHGIMNQYGYKTKFIIYLELDNVNTYVTDYYSDDIELKVIVDDDGCTIGDTEYDLQVFNKNNEIFIIGKEKIGWLHWFTCHMIPQKFFVVSNHEEV